MANTDEIDAIFWDFDGVLMNSNLVRDRGFEQVLSAYPASEVEELMRFHQANGGLSRYVKFRYFFEEIRGESITEQEINVWASKFSEIMRRLLADPSLLIMETVNYVKQMSGVLPMYIVSGSDQEELRYLCQTLDIAQHFDRIHGSPTPKKAWVATLISEMKLTASNCILVGDSINDFEAAETNHLHFMAYNNDSLNQYTTLKLSF